MTQLGSTALGTYEQKTPHDPERPDEDENEQEDEESEDEDEDDEHNIIGKQ